MRALSSRAWLSSFSLVSLLLLAGMVAFVLMALGAFMNLEEVLARDRVREHARQAQLLIRRTAVLMLDLETGQRGFIITGEAVFLEPYERARREFEATYGALKKHLAAGPQPSPEMSYLDELSRQRFEQVEHNVERRWAVGEAVLKDMPSFTAGKLLMDEIRGELSRLEAEQDGHIRRADAGTQAVQRRTVLLVETLPALGCVLIFGALLALAYERRRRDRAERALKDANADLEATVASRTAQLRTALTRIQSFASELDASVENERRKLAREVHDQIGQIGTATKMLVLGLRRTLPPGFEDSVQELLSLADESITTARGISASLRPPLLDDFGLGAALDHYGQGLARRSGIAVEVALEGDEQLSLTQANSLFRIAQEACTNVLRHAEAKRLRLRGHAVEGGRYVLEIVDDGKGPGSVRADASGLRNMRERAALLGGVFEFGPAPGGGARVAVMLPIENKQEAQEEGVLP